MVCFSAQRRQSVAFLCALVMAAALPFDALAAVRVKTLHSFATVDGRLPMAPLVQVGTDFFGSTQYGGASNVGTVFRMKPSGAVKVLHSFANDGVDGKQALSGLTLASDGLLYGTTQKGGSNGQGTVYRISPSGNYSVLHSFVGTGGAPAQPSAGLIQASDGNFYGTSYQGGSAGTGSIYRITPAGVVTVLHAFVVADGTLPTAGLVQASDGNFYGTTSAGGISGVGTAYKMTPAGVFSVLHNFEPVTSGANPWAGLVQASDGFLYGVTGTGGPGGAGTLFKLSLTGTLTRVFSFGPTLGGTPTGTLVQGSDGFLYGTTYVSQVPNNEGTVFRMSLAGTQTVLHRFVNNGLGGTHPWAGVSFGADGRLYGSTVNGGVNDAGSLYRITLP